MITFLWAQTKNGVIGKSNHLPWNIKAEMQHFINYTKNKTVLMGRNTWESLKIKPLPNRKNIVITSRPLEQEYREVIVTNDLNKVIQEYKNSDQELVVIGGKKIFDSLLNDADKLVISVIKQDYDGDVYAPNWDKSVYDLTSQEDYSEFNVEVYQRIKH